MMAILLIYLFAEVLGLLPATGWVRIGDDLGANLRGAALPALSIAIGELAVYTRLLRSDMIATLQEDYIALGRAKGVPTFWILLRHALRPSSRSEEHTSELQPLMRSSYAVFRLKDKHRFSHS